MKHILAAVDELSRQPLWPAFDPRTIPLVIYDGENTWLMRHPHPGAPWSQRAGPEAIWGMSGLHESVRANTATAVDGVPTASLMLTSGDGRSAREVAAVCIHEMFHVFQQDRHPTWIGNVTAMFLYPLSDPALLTRRRLETEAWRRAQAATDLAVRHGWARTALGCRRARFDALPPACAAFERGTELSEGLAQYVHDRALGRSSVTLPTQGYPPAEARRRCYAVGALMARLLEGVAPGWPEMIEASTGLDGLLDAALDDHARASAFTALEREHIAQRAAADDAAFRNQRKQQLQEVQAAPGHRVVLRGHTPLDVHGFDPANCVQLDDATVLHSRYLQVASAHLELEMLGGQAITHAAAGNHPLFDGVAEVMCVGLAALPELPPGAKHLTWHGEGLSITGEADRLTITGHDLVMDLP